MTFKQKVILSRIKVILSRIKVIVKRGDPYPVRVSRCLKGLKSYSHAMRSSYPYGRAARKREKQLPNLLPPGAFSDCASRTRKTQRRKRNYPGRTRRPSPGYGVVASQQALPGRLLPAHPGYARASGTCSPWAPAETRRPLGTPRLTRC